MVYNLFKSLGLTSSASIEEIKKAYRQLAKEYHPDKNKDGAEKFKEISNAYSILIDPEKRRDYMFKFGAQEESSSGRRGFTADDSYEYSYFGFRREAHPPPPPPQPKKTKEDYQIRTTYTATLEEVYLGLTVKVNYKESRECPTCHGNPKQSTLKRSEKCRHCDGVGRMPRTVGQKAAIPQTCNFCNGKGYRSFYQVCGDCQNEPFVNKKVSVALPKGIHDNTPIRVKNKGLLYPDGKTRGSLIINVLVRDDHPLFKRHGDNLSCNVTISLKEAIMGFKNKLLCTHLDGRYIHATQPMGQVIKPGSQRLITKEGMPVFNSTNDARGDLTITFKIEFPDTVQVPETKEARLAVDALFTTDQEKEAKENPIVIDDEEESKNEEGGEEKAEENGTNEEPVQANSPLDDPITIQDDDDNDDEMKEASEHEQDIPEFFNISDEEEEDAHTAPESHNGEEEQDEEEDLFSDDGDFPHLFNVFL